MTNDKPKKQENKPAKLKAALAILLIIFTGIAIYYYKQNEINNKNQSSYSKTETIEVKKRTIYSAKANYEKVQKNIGNKKLKTWADISIDYCAKYSKLDNRCLSLKKRLKSNKFCYRFLEDFKNGKDIEVIEPTIIINNYNSKKLAPYFKKCPDFKKFLNAYVPLIGSSKEWQVVYGMTTQEVEKMNDVILDYVDGPFLLYDIDFDNNPANGKQVLFYNEYDYKFLDFDKCKETKHSITVETNHGVIKYKRKYYIYETTGNSDVIEFHSYSSNESDYSFSINLI